jgi:hypothetical protein
VGHVCVSGPCVCEFCMCFFKLRCVWCVYMHGVWVCMCVYDVCSVCV